MEKISQKTQKQLQEEVEALQARVHELEKSSALYKKTEAGLRIIESQQKSILDNIPDIAWLKDKESRFIAVNEPFGQACGYSPKDLMGKTDLDIWPPDLAQKYREDDKEVMKSGKRKRVEESLIRKGGEIQWIETIKTPIYNDKNEIIGTTGISRDITERKQIENRLREVRAELEIRVKVRTAELTKANEDLHKEVNERLKTENILRDNERFLFNIFSSIKDGISVLDPEMKIIRVNPAMERWYSHAMPLAGKKCFAAYHGRSSPCEICPVVKTLNTGEACHEIVPRHGNNGKTIGWFDLYSFPLFDHKTKELRGIIEYVRDITEQKEAEEELAQYRQDLEEIIKERTNELENQIKERNKAEYEARTLRQRIEFILGATKTGLDIIDADYNMIYVDPEWSKVYGDYKGKKCFEYFMGKREICPECGVKKAFATKSIVVSEEILVKENNRPIQVTTIPFQDAQGIWMVAEVNVDICEHKKIDTELQKYRDGLEDLVKARTIELEREILVRRNVEKRIEALNKELSESNKKFKQLALIDSHTGLYNHRYLEEIIESEFHRVKRYAYPLAVIMLDIDYFKSINDLYGHNFGDLVLKQFAHQLKQVVRRYDMVIRYGGEEFVIISPVIEREQALTLAQRILDALNLFYFGNKKHVVKLKVSLAVVSLPEDRISKGIELINLADQILNKAKEDGGNRVYSSEDLHGKELALPEKGKQVINVKLLKGKIAKLNKETNQGLIESIFALSKTIELKDHYTGEHVENTVKYAVSIAQGLNLPKNEIELIGQSAMLHDLGKIGISENILLKKSKLTKREFEEIKKHPQIAVDIIRPIHLLRNLIPLILYHHERWDGKGYPMGIKGEEIPVGARIIALADVYQALISDRPYRKAFDKKEAVRIIREKAGSQFDPGITAVFLKILESEEKKEPYKK